MPSAFHCPQPWREREIVLSRVYDAPRALVFKMWTDPDHAMKWFGPKGFTCTLHEMNVCVGGRWRFDMKAPNGTVYPNRIEYLEIVPNERLVFDHGNDIENDPKRFRVTITFDEQADKKTVLTLRQLHPTKELRDAGVGFGAARTERSTGDPVEWDIWPADAIRGRQRAGSDRDCGFQR